ncbi:MAG TPA: M23 family metallopeptidase [Saprospiraceae bacterium]|nr:M23 family metallopeptidase [Saprospiraceae bacterium]
MKFYKLIFWIWLGTSNVLFAQIKIQQIVSHEGHLETDHGGPTVCLGTAERIAVQERINKAVRDMKNDGLLERVFPQHQRAMPPLLQWPLRQSDKYNDPGYYAISNYADLDPTPVNVLDYNGLNQTYDGHNGIDIRVWPYWWKKMDDSHVEVVAAADGIIIFKQDGFNDQSCAFNGNSWNAVFLLHADGSITWYGHLKQNSTTVKDSGDVVTVGEYLGVVGSSGNSTNPHLHLECYDDLGNRIEPFAGTSNPTITNSWWANQLPYYDTGVNKIATHFAAPVTPPCPGIESPNEKDYFNPGDSIFFTASIRHSLTADSARVQAIQPNGVVSTVLNAAYQRTGGFFTRSAQPIWNRQLPNNAMVGKWTYRVTYYSQTYGTSITNHTFWVAQPCTPNLALGGIHSVNNYFQASNSITSNAEINLGVHVVYDAENYTILGGGFIAPTGSKLEIKTTGCN